MGNIPTAADFVKESLKLSIYCYIKAKVPNFVSFVEAKLIYEVQAENL